MNQLQVSSWATILVLASGVAVCVAWAVGLDAAPRVTVGPRGRQRSIALREVVPFAVVEPAVRWLAARFSRLPLQSVRASASLLLQRAGNYMGLGADELLALGVVVAIVTAGLGAWLGFALEAPVTGSLLGLMLGPVWLASSLYARCQQRAVAADRGLPVAIDLIAMCVGAGLDLPGAVRLVVEAAPTRGDVLQEELRMLLRELELGRSRAHALGALAERLPTRSLSEFVSALTQAEEKGTPLAEVLRIQATVLRGRRSVMAEEAAARAGVLMMLPLLLLLACVMLIAMGGMVIRGTETGL